MSITQWRSRLFAFYNLLFGRGRHLAVQTVIEHDRFDTTFYHLITYNQISYIISQSKVINDMLMYAQNSHISIYVYVHKLLAVAFALTYRDLKKNMNTDLCVPYFCKHNNRH